MMEYHDDIGGSGFFSSNPSLSGSNSLNSGPTPTTNRIQHSSLVPSTIRQIHLAKLDHDELFLINQQSVSQVRIVGQILNVIISNSSTTNTYLIDDGTSKIEVRVWLHDDPSGISDYHSCTKHEWREGVYVTVYGSIKLNGPNRRSIVAHRMKTITNYNEISHHFIEIIHVHLFHTKPKNNSPLPSNILNNSSNNPYNNSNSPLQHFYNQYGRIGGEIIIQCKNSPMQGISSSTLLSKLPSLNESDLRSEINKLLTLGMIYSTIDDHWKS